MKRFCSILSFAAFMGVLGFVGNIERNIVSPRVGMGRIFVCLLLSVVFGLLAGAFKEKNHE